MALRIRNNKDIKGFQIKIDEQTHSIKISQLADDTTQRLLPLQHYKIQQNQ
jgi:hypothetical protein